MDPPLLCPICGVDSVNETPSKPTLSSGPSIFQCFLKLFGLSWKGKNFPFCSHCKVKLKLITQLQEDIKELEKKLKEHEKELVKRFHGSETEFQKKEVYSKDDRYFKLRRQIVKRDKTSSTTQQFESQLEVDEIKVEVNENAPGFCDVDEDEGFPGSLVDPLLPDEDPQEEESPSKRTLRKRRRVPPLRYTEEGNESEEDRNPKKSKVKPVKEKEAPTEEKDKESEENEDLDYILPDNDIDEAEESDQDQDQDDVISQPKPGRRRRKKKPKNSDKDVIYFYNISLARVPSEDSYKCSKCSLILPNKIDAMRSHIAREHTSLFVCSTCEKRFDSLAHLKRHENYVHTKITPEVRDHCPICDKPFTRLDHMKGHIWTHKSEEDKAEAIARGEKLPYGKRKSFQCTQDDCGRMFTTMGMLDKHIQKKHVENVPERGKQLCGVCGVAVRNLHIHIEMKHKAYEDRRYSCSLCGKKFAFSAQLCNHRKQAHATDKPWKCEVCGRDFKLEKYFNEHRLGHEEVKPFKCHLCGMGFTRGYVLKRHVATVHEGEKRKAYKKRGDVETKEESVE